MDLDCIWPCGPLIEQPADVAACPVCFARGGHWAWCQCGYSQPPPSTERAPAPVEPEMCCGGTCLRELCDFHGPGKG